MSNVRQISVFVDNKPNQLAGVMKMIKECRINVRALSLADTSDFGIVRMIVNDTDKTVEKLKATSYAVTVTEVVAISIPDSPGQLSRVLDILGGKNVNLEYLYTFLGKSDRSVSFVIRVDDIANASEALTDGGIIQLTENDIAEM
ncbi:MAG: amino acid-binding protein [Ruminococcus sp.]|uniref:amino acid-binding protein n=1 Tax=Ruminococcus sp. TaxID=41978 RepID=UPI0025F6598D|nr:amino acid-binding protein [Ruminococcus sp.]MBR5684472.1 amino acid-binding protein [Ruminococcus sp.]